MINLKVTKALAVGIPPSLLSISDEVIEKPALVRIWHETDMAGMADDVCFRGQNGHADLAQPLPVLTQPGHEAELWNFRPGFLGSVSVASCLNWQARAAFREAPCPAVGTVMDHCPVRTEDLLSKTEIAAGKGVLVDVLQRHGVVGVDGEYRVGSDLCGIGHRGCKIRK
jgi:hypothetical protein